MIKYRLDVNKKQISVIASALEFYSRWCSGQWKIPDTMEYQEFINHNKNSDFWAKRNQVEDSLNSLKTILTNLPLNASYGIGSSKLCESANIAYDLYRPILELRAKEYNEANPDNEHWTVYDSPGLSYSKEGRIEIKTIEE